MPNETLISTLTIDFNNDTFDDEVIVVRKSGFPYLLVIPGLYNSETNSYDRLEEIETKGFQDNGIWLKLDDKNKKSKSSFLF